MKSLQKIALVALVGGVGTTAIYAAPGLEGGGTADPQLMDMIVKANAIHEQNLDDARHVYHLQESARRQKDIIKLNCINDKLVQLKPQINQIERLQLDLQASVGNGAAVFGQITVASESVRQLRDEADGCAGEGAVGALESSNGYTAPPIPDTPYGNPWNGEGTIEPPAYASPFD